MEQEYSIQRISLDKVSSFLVFRKGAAILIDCGNNGSEEKIQDALSGVGLGPGDLKLLILTHAHFDHAGSAAKLKEWSGCRILVHSLEVSRLREGFAPLPRGTRWKAKILMVAGRLLARRIGSFPGVDPDMELSDTMDLNEFGFPGRVIPTPGHTHGSMIILMDGGELFAGDTLFGIPWKEHFPPFAEDLPALLRSWKQIRDMPVNTIYPAHGLHFSRESFLAEFEQAMKKYG